MVSLFIDPISCLSDIGFDETDSSLKKVIVNIIFLYIQYIRHLCITYIMLNQLPTHRWRKSLDEKYIRKLWCTQIMYTIEDGLQTNLVFWWTTKINPGFPGSWATCCLAVPCVQFLMCSCLLCSPLCAVCIYDITLADISFPISSCLHHHFGFF